jgi:hypothetical protein
MKFCNIHKLLLVSICMFFAVPGSGDLANTSPDVVARSLAENLIDLNRSLHIVMAIDDSASMNRVKNTKQVAFEFLDAIQNNNNYNNNNNNIQVGYVVWSNNSVARSDNLSYYTENINKELNDTIRLRGNTCFKIALDESVKLLRKEEKSGVFNVIVIMSDGIENCNNGTNLDCQKFYEMKNLQDIYIYPIQISESGDENSLLSCLTRPILFNSTPGLPGSSNIIQSGNDGNIHKNALINNLINFQLVASEIARKDINTNMTVTKSIKSGAFGPRISIELAAPSVKSLKTSVVIALDSSGSLGKGGRTEYGDNIRESMPIILESIEAKMPFSNVSVVSWDDDIDFAYGNLNNSDPLKALLMPITIARKEISDNEIFIRNSTLDQFPFNYIYSRGYPTKYYYCNETESTNLSKGLDSSAVILKKSIQGRFDATRKLIILVAGRSEFIPCNKNIIAATKEDHFNVHTVGVGVIEESEMQKELIRIAGTKEKYHYSPGSSFFNHAAVSSAVDGALEQFYKENISNNLKLVETLYPYLRLDEKSLQATNNGEKLDKNDTKFTLNNNSDGTTTFEIEFRNNLTMKPEDKIIVSFDTYLDLSLPVDYTERRTPKQYLIGQNTSKSYVSYTWLDNNEIYNIDLPQSHILIN